MVARRMRRRSGREPPHPSGRPRAAIPRRGAGRRSLAPRPAYRGTPWCDAVTDANGRFELEVPQMGHAVVTAVAERCEAVQLTVDCATGDDLVIRMRPVGKLHGVVCTPDGTPAGHVQLHV